MSFWRKMAGTTSVKLLLAAAIVVSWLPMKAVPAFAADTAIVNDDFSTYSLGALTLGSGNKWASEGGVPTVNVSHDSVTGITYGAVSFPSADPPVSSYFGQRFTPETGGMLIQFDVNMPATTNVSFFLMDGKINATNAVASQFQIQNGTIKKMTAKNTGTTLVNYDASHWYRFSMIVNVPKQKYSLTIKDLNTGTEVVTDQSFYTATLQRVSSFSFWNNKLVDMQKINVTNVKLTSLDLTLSSLAVNSGGLCAISLLRSSCAKLHD